MLHQVLPDYLLLVLGAFCVEPEEVFKPDLSIIVSVIHGEQTYDSRVIFIAGILCAASSEVHTRGWSHDSCAWIISIIHREPLEPFSEDVSSSVTQGGSILIK
jgi:hypothetical protein